MNEDQVCLIKSGPSITNNTPANTQCVRYSVRCVLPFTSRWQVQRGAVRGFSKFHNTGTEVEVTVRLWTLIIAVLKLCVLKQQFNAGVALYEETLFNKSAICTDTLQ